jgi:hypothetical protein
MPRRVTITGGANGARGSALRGATMFTITKNGRTITLS